MAIARRPERRFPDPGQSPNRPRPDDRREVHAIPGPVTLTRHEEEADFTAERVPAGQARLRKRVDQVLAHADIERLVDDPSVERRPAGAGDSGEVETLPDGSMSIPIFEEEIVVTKRMVVRERMIIRKGTRTEHLTVPVTLKKERVVIEADESVKGRIRGR